MHYNEINFAVQYELLFEFEMGASVQKSELGYFKRGDWLQLQTDGQRSHYRNKLTGEEVQVVQLHCQSQNQLREAVQLYRERLELSNNVIRLEDMWMVQPGNCGDDCQVTVVFQWVDSRLSEHSNIIEKECVLILEEVLHGCRQIYEKLGIYFQVRPEMILLNREKYIKVWFDPDIASNYPKYPIRAADPQHLQILTAIEAVKRHCELMDFKPAFKRLLGGHDRPLRYQTTIQALKLYGQSKNSKLHQYDSFGFQPGSLVEASTKAISVPDKKRVGASLFASALSKPKFQSR